MHRLSKRDTDKLVMYHHPLAATLSGINLQVHLTTEIRAYSCINANVNHSCMPLDLRVSTDHALVHVICIEKSPIQFPINANHFLH